MVRHPTAWEAGHWSEMPLDQQELFATDEGFLNGRVRWYVKWTSDLLLYWANNHVLLSCFMANRHNLYHRWERFVVLLCQLGVSYFLTVYTRDFWYQYDSDSPIDEDFYTHPVVIGTSLALIAYTELLKLLIVAGCFQPYGCCAHFGTSLKACFSEVSHAGVALCVLISVTLVIIGAVDDHHQTYKGWIAHTSYTWVISFLTDAAKFAVFYLFQKHHKAKSAYPIKGLPTPAYITTGEPMCCSCCLSHADKRITTDNEGYDDTEAGPNVNPYKAPPSGDSGSGELSERLMP